MKERCKIIPDTLNETSHGLRETREAAPTAQRTETVPCLLAIHNAWRGGEGAHNYMTQ